MTIDDSTHHDDEPGRTPPARQVRSLDGDPVGRAGGAHTEVPTGELRAAQDGRLRASAIGSCVVLALVDPATGIGGLAHVMLPGEAPPRLNVQRSKYAVDGVRELVQTMTDLGARPDGLVACIAGGGNVLERPGDTLCEENIRSVVHTLTGLGVALPAREVGGVQRRSLTLDVDTGEVVVTVGDGRPTLLWRVDVHGRDRGGTLHE